MKLFPAIDIYSGRVVRLTKGDYNAMKVYEKSPLAAALRWRKAGAGCLHAVDLEGARDGAATNSREIRELITESGMEVQVGGGIRNMNTVALYLDAGAARVILGTAALENRAFLRTAVGRYGEKIAVGVDAREGLVAVRGWEQTTSVTLTDFVRELEDMGVATVIVTDISRDGAMQGANLALYERLRAECSMNIVASGGISSLSEISTLKDLGIWGAILGKGLYENTLSLEEALEAAR